VPDFRGPSSLLGLGTLRRIDRPLDLSGLGPNLLLHPILGALGRILDRNDFLAATGTGSEMETGSTSARHAGQW
jgi:hypothetical protein